MSPMRLEMLVKQKLSQELRMAPHIIQSIEVLTLPALELQTFIQQQLETNPVLDTNELSQTEDEPAAPEAEEHTSTQEPPVEGAAEVEKPVDEEFLNNFENLQGEEWDDYYSRDRIRKSGDEEKDKKQEAMQNTADKPITLQDFLFQQFGLLELPEDWRRIGEQIIYNIDANGYLGYPLEEIIKNLEPIPALPEAEKVLHCIQCLEPTGICARNLQECLLLQLSETDSNYLFKRELIEKHLHDISTNKYPKIAKETGRTIEEVKEMVQEIQKLNPKPGANYSNEQKSCIIPDLVLEIVDGEYIIRLENSYIPQLHINHKYLQLLQQTADKASPVKEFIKKKIESANWIIEAIKQRQHTLFRVANRVVEHQQEFFEHGPSHLKPLKMQDVADDLEIHVSTVSRAISDKYIQTPRGVLPLKFFFTGSIDKKDGDNESRVTVQERIQEIIAQEDKQNPLSDDDIAVKLKQLGLAIARRTITKYRKALKIASSRQRKQY